MHSFIQSQRGIPGATKADKRRSVKQRISIRLRSPEEPWERILVGAARRTSGWPQERLPKINAIISNIVAGGPEWNASLKSCSLVSHRLLVPSQRFLFRSFRLHNSNAIMLCAFFKDSKHLASYVRDLQVDLDFERQEIQAIAVKLLRLFSNVRRASLSVGHWLAESFPRTSRLAIIDFLSLHSLQSILFLGRANGSLPSSVLLHALSFRTAVALQHILVHQDSHFMPSPVGYQERSPLRHLVLALQPGMIPPVRDLLLDPALAHRVGTLQHLRVARFSPPINLSIHGLENVALQCSETLQHLDIDLKDESAINLPALPDLRFLTLRATVHKAHVPDTLMYALATLPTCVPQVEVITIIIHANEHRETNFIASPDADAALTSLQRLRATKFILASQTSNGVLHFRGSPSALLFRTQLTPLHATEQDRSMAKIVCKKYLHVRHWKPKTTCILRFNFETTWENYNFKVNTT
ncbi:hypothetical protein B0H13DRAFT_1851368 [Mycena leptocephala]|nr:hypothetical protein B0H13DRAFT_1901101 [Mycena leptocephala]KAJ7938781.1 hypothetical protein B0H13DRAFT_1851368 [Mycena leptocephala]